MRDWPRKLAAIVLAVMIFFSVRMQLQTEEPFNDCEVIVRPEGNRIAVLQSENIKTNLVLRGTKRSLQKIKNNPTIEHIVPANTPAGPYAFRLRPDDVKLPPGVRVSPDGIQPADFQVLIDPIVQQDTKIRLRLNRETLPSGLATRTVVIHPKNATIVGPKKFVQEVTEVVTREVNFDKDPPMSYELDVDLLKIPNVTIKPEKVRVSIELTRSKDTRLYRKIPIEVMTAVGSDLYVQEFIDAAGKQRPTVDVTLEGPAATLDFLTAHSIRAFIELSEDDGAGTYNLPVRIWVYVQDCTVQKHSPTTIKVKVGRRNNRRRP